MSADPALSPLLDRDDIEGVRVAFRREAEVVSAAVRSAMPESTPEALWEESLEGVAGALARIRPGVLHLAGLGSPTADLVLRTGAGAARPLTDQEVARLVGEAPQKPTVVVLSGCDSVDRAAALATVVGAVIGLPKALGPGRALDFAGGFYAALGAGLEIEEALIAGAGKLDLASIAESVAPRLVTTEGVLIASPLPDGRIELVPPASGFKGGGVSAAAGREMPVAEVWFGTNRKPAGTFAPPYFTSERDDRLHYGTCKVTVPKAHRIGSLGLPFWKRLFRLNRKAKSFLDRVEWLIDDRMRLASVTAFADEAEFFGRARAALGARPVDERDALVFLHGYNVSFEEAALRAAQIGFDLQVRGITAFYSWPSRGTMLGYLADGATIEASETFIISFLRRMAQVLGDGRVHLLAHSMGNRGLLRSVDTIVKKASAEGLVKFGQVILAAPDVDTHMFKQLAPAYSRVAKRTTLYASNQDKALKSALILHRAGRAGFSPPPTTLPNVLDTVDVTDIDLSFLGHGYFAAARPVIGDIFSLLVNDAPPSKRMGLRRAQTDNGDPYWVIGA